MSTSRNVPLQRVSAVQYYRGYGSFQWQKAFWGVRWLVTPPLIKIHFFTIDDVNEISRRNEFLDYHPEYGEVAAFFCFLWPSNIVYSPSGSADFDASWLKRRGLCQDVSFGGRIDSNFRSEFFPKPPNFLAEVVFSSWNLCKISDEKSDIHHIILIMQVATGWNKIKSGNAPEEF